MVCWNSSGGVRKGSREVFYISSKQVLYGYFEEFNEEGSDFIRVFSEHRYIFIHTYIHADTHTEAAPHQNCCLHPSTSRLQCCSSSSVRTIKQSI